MTSIQRVAIARDSLAIDTPLKADCGKLCGGACCQPDEDGHGGMLLFPGEEAFYDLSSDWATLTQSNWIIQGSPLVLLTCQGRCPRNERPLACRIFPLAPHCRDGSLSIALDVRAWPLCPLMPYGIEGLSRDFVKKVSAAMKLLWEDTQCRDYITQLSGYMDNYGKL